MDEPVSFDPANDPGRFLSAIVESSEDAIVGKTLDGVIVTWNRGAERLYGYTAGEMRGRSVSLLFPDGAHGELESLLQRIRSGQRVEYHETVRVARDGRPVNVWLSVAPVIDSEGRIVGAATIARNYAEQKQTQAALTTSEQRWRTLIEAAVDGIIVIDARGRVESFNPAAERLFGYTAAEMFGQNVSVLMPSPHREEHDSYMARYLTTGQARIIGKGREVIGRCKDGRTFPMHLSVGEMHVLGERKFTGIIHDLSSRVRMEEQLREQAAMVRLGEMAALVAHEVKNPLAGIRGAIQVIGSRLPAGSRDAAITHEIVQRIDGLNELMKDLLLYARPPLPRPHVVDLADLVTTTASLLRDDPDAAGVQVEVSGSAPAIPGDPDLLKIVFLNLLVNAAHAMKGIGTIHVSIETADGYCRVVVADGGPGIPDAIRERIFTPFFTTKSRGSGLGLPTARRLVEAHGGTIDIACPSSGGTVVTIQLPA